MSDSPVPSKHARSHEEAVLIAGGPVASPPSPDHVPDLAFIRERMPSRTDHGDYLVHALRFFEDVLEYAERLERTL